MAGAAHANRMREILRGQGLPDLAMPEDGGDVSGIGSGKMRGNMAWRETEKAGASELTKTANTDQAVLVATLVEIVKSLIGVDPTTLDPTVVKSLLTAALKKAGKETCDLLGELVGATTKGQWIRDGARLSIAV